MTGGFAGFVGAHFRLCTALLVLLAALTYIPGLAGVPPIDRDEPRYVQASKQMVERGDYVDIRLQDEPRYKKPIGIYWLQAAAVEVSGYGADAPLWAYRLPSLLGAVLTVLGTVIAARAFMGPLPALAAGLITLAIVVLNVEAHLAKTDAMLTATVVFAQAALARIWLAERKSPFLGWPLAFWIAIAASILIKGPIGLMVCGLTVAWLTVANAHKWRWLGRLHILPGLLLAIALVLPWFIAINMATHGAFFQEAVVKDFLGKAGSGQEGHWAPPLTHLLMSVGVAWPAMALAVVGAGAMWAQRRTQVMRFLMAWVIPSWIVFEMVATKLPHYTLPLLPALAIGASFALLGNDRPLPVRWLRWLGALELAGLPIVLVPAVVVLPLLLGDRISFVAIVLTLLGAAAAVYAAKLLIEDRDRLRAVCLAVGASILLNVAAWGLVLPRLDSLWLSPRIAAAAQADAGCPDPVLVSVGFREMSLVFLAGTDTVIASPQQAADVLAATPCAVLAVDAHEKAETLAAIEAKGVVLEETGTETGRNIGNGDILEMTLFRRAQP
ncbi:4-amino-4-deoxy-L-arabinose transferase-like glycosyltransferase [Amorphus suaedae]